MEVECTVAKKNTSNVLCWFFSSLPFLFAPQVTNFLRIRGLLVLLGLTNLTHLWNEEILLGKLSRCVSLGRNLE